MKIGRHQCWALVSGCSAASALQNDQREAERRGVTNGANRCSLGWPPLNGGCEQSLFFQPSLCRSEVRRGFGQTYRDDFVIERNPQLLERGALCRGSPVAHMLCRVSRESRGTQERACLSLAVPNALHPEKTSHGAPEIAGAVSVLTVDSHCCLCTVFTNMGVNVSSKAYLVLMTPRLIRFAPVEQTRVADRDVRP